METPWTCGPRFMTGLAYRTFCCYPVEAGRESDRSGHHSPSDPRNILTGAEESVLPGSDERRISQDMFSILSLNVTGLWRLPAQPFFGKSEI